MVGITERKRFSERKKGVYILLPYITDIWVAHMITCMCSHHHYYIIHYVLQHGLCVSSVLTNSCYYTNFCYICNWIYQAHHILTQWQRIFSLLSDGTIKLIFVIVLMKTCHLHKDWEICDSNINSYICEIVSYTCIWIFNFKNI